MCYNTSENKKNFVPQSHVVFCVVSDLRAVVNHHLEMLSPFLTMTLSLQVAKFPFEEVPASKQGAKQQLCPSSVAPVSAPSAPGSAGVLDIETKIGSFIDYVLCCRESVPCRESPQSQVPFLRSVQHFQPVL